MKCNRCGKEEAKTGRCQKYCAECQPIVKREQKTAAERRRRERLGDKYREYQRQTYANMDPEKRKEIKRQQYQNSINTEAKYEKVKERTRLAMAKFRDSSLYGGQREAVFERDNHQCTVCGKKENLSIHHIDGNGWSSPKEEKNNDIDNLITLCHSCHARLHRELEQLERMPGLYRLQ